MPKLTAAYVRGAREPGRYYDAPHGNGLFLQVDASGARRWGQRLTIKKRRAELGLGGFPLVSLSEAREAAFDNRKLARAGGDPMANRRRPGAPKLRTAVEAVIKLRTGGWRHGGRTEAAWRSCFEQHVYPILGERTVAEIGAGDLLKVLSPIWHERAAAARKVKPTPRAHHGVGRRGRAPRRRSQRGRGGGAPGANQGCDPSPCAAVCRG